jgi:hypothetical protein
MNAYKHGDKVILRASCYELCEIRRKILISYFRFSFSEAEPTERYKAAVTKLFGKILIIEDFVGTDNKPAYYFNDYNLTFFNEELLSLNDLKFKKLKEVL